MEIILPHFFITFWFFGKRILVAEWVLYSRPPWTLTVVSEVLVQIQLGKVISSVAPAVLRQARFIPFS